MSGALELDFVRELADAWDGRGNNVLMAAERRALWALAYQEPFENPPMWAALSPQTRQRLVRAARHAIEFGRQCQALLR